MKKYISIREVPIRTISVGGVVQPIRRGNVDVPSVIADAPINRIMVNGEEAYIDSTKTAYVDVDVPIKGILVNGIEAEIDSTCNAIVDVDVPIKDIYINDEPVYVDSSATAYAYVDVPVKGVYVDGEDVVDSTGNAIIYIPEVDIPVKDVYVDGESVVDSDGTALIDIPVKDVYVDGESVVDSTGVAIIDLLDAPVKDVKVNGESVVSSSSGIANIDVPITSISVGDKTYEPQDGEVNISFDDIDLLDSTGEETQASIIRKVNELIRKFKRTSISLLMMACASFGVFAEDVVVSGTRFDMIKGKQVLYLKSDIDILLQNCKPKRYPMFVYRLNDVIPNIAYTTNETTGAIQELEYPNASDPYSYTQWTDFELKATTNNFYAPPKTSAATLRLVNDKGEVVTNMAKNVNCLANNKNIQYLSLSNASIVEPELGDDCDPVSSMRKYVHATKVGGVDVDSRSLTFYSEIGQLECTPTQVTFILDPTKFTHIPDNSWCNSWNEEVIWSIARCDSNGEFEKDDDGKVMWRTITPVCWFKELPNWAYTNGEIRVVNDKWYRLYNR